MTTHLLIPDPHAHPDYDNRRFKWLGKLIAGVNPDHVICIGDFADMPSLSSYDRGTKGFEGRRYQHDLVAVQQALSLLRDPIKARKKRLPKFWMLHGNHEYRITRAIENDAAHLDGTISLRDLGYRDYGWEEVPYEGSTPGTLILDGICYAHYLTGGLMGRPISGVHTAANLLNKKMMSCSVGHSHIRDFSSRTRADGLHINGLVSGCFFEHSPSYAGLTARDFWRGITIKTDVSEGQYDMQWISMKAIKAMYK